MLYIVGTIRIGRDRRWNENKEMLKILWVLKPLCSCSCNGVRCAGWRLCPCTLKLAGVGCPVACGLWPVCSVLCPPVEKAKNEKLKTKKKELASIVDYCPHLLTVATAALSYHDMPPVNCHPRTRAPRLRVLSLAARTARPLT